MIEINTSYNDKEQKIIMCESEYDNEKYYISEFREGAIGVVIIDGNSYALLAKKIIRKSDDPDFYETINIPENQDLQQYSYAVEFITDKDCFIVGFDEICEDNIIVPCYC